MNQVMEIGSKLSFQERTEMFRLIRAYDKNKSPILARKLCDDYGFVIDRDNGDACGDERTKGQYDVDWELNKDEPF